MKNKKMFKTLYKILMLVVITAIPLIYSFFYLKAFWDPYSNTKDMPIAIVNLDKGDSDENLGNELVNKLEEKDVLKITLEENTDIAKDKLIHREYYAIITIPESFSVDLNNAENEDREIAQITYSPNQKTNYLASQIINKVVTNVEIELRKQISGEIVEGLVGKLNEVPDKMNEINDAATKLSDGSKEIVNATQKISDGLKSLNENYTTFNSNISELDSEKMNNSLTQIAKLSTDVNDILKSSSDLITMKQQVNTLMNKLNLLTGSVSTYIGKVTELNNNNKAVLQGIVSYGDANSTIKADPNFMDIYSNAKEILDSKGIESINGYGQSINDGITELNDGLLKMGQAMNKLDDLQVKVDNIKTTVAKLVGDTSKAKDKVEEIRIGIKKLVGASNQIQTGIRDLSTGGTKLLSGTESLYDGTNTFKTEISKKISDTRKELQKLNGLSEYSQNPVEIVENDYSHVDEYGIVFAPYFMSLSLWVGALVLFIVLYYDTEGRFKHLTKEAPNRILRAFLYLLLAVAQALLLGFLLKKFIGFEVTNIWTYYSSCVLISAVFLSIIQFLIVNFKDVGKFLSIFFLILQLAASGGTFPIETTPKFFQAIYPYMPMHYSINLIKESLISIDNGFIGSSVAILGGILLASIVFTVLFDLIKITRRVLRKRLESKKGLESK